MLILVVIFVIFIGMVIGGGVDRGAYRVSYQLSVIGRSSVTLIFLMSHELLRTLLKE
jgi:hypothetical protein